MVVSLARGSGRVDAIKDGSVFALGQWCLERGRQRCIADESLRHGEGFDDVGEMAELSVDVVPASCQRVHLGTGRVDGLACLSAQSVGLLACLREGPDEFLAGRPAVGVGLAMVLFVREQSGGSAVRHKLELGQAPSTWHIKRSISRGRGAPAGNSDSLSRASAQAS